MPKKCKLVVRNQLEKYFFPKKKEFKSLPVQEIESTPGPKYSTIAPVPPFTVKIPATFRITSVKTQK